jgi:hypothetical protein
VSFIAGLCVVMLAAAWYTRSRRWNARQIDQSGMGGMGGVVH